MNYLAHCWLTPQDAATLAGAVFGDLIHGRDLSHLPARVAWAIRTHRRIDRETDSFAPVVALRSAMPPRFRRYAGILLDMAFDHVLARDFACFSELPLPAFAAKVYAALERYAPCVSAERLPRLRYIQRHDLLCSYQHKEAVLAALQGIGGRLLRANPLAESAQALAPLWPQIEALTPELLAHLQACAAECALTLPPAET